jgi:hypothetical protein
VANEEISTVLHLLLLERFPDLESVTVFDANIWRGHYDVHERYTHVLEGFRARGEYFRVTKPFAFGNLEPLIWEVNRVKNRIPLLKASDEELVRNLRRIARKHGMDPKKVSRPSDLSRIYNPDKVRLVKAGVTPGHRRYEVLDSLLGRSVAIFGGIDGTRVVWLTSLRPSVLTAFQWNRISSIPKREPREFAKWLWRSNRKYSTNELPSACPVLERIIALAASPVLNLVDLRGTYAPHLRESRLRKLAKVVLDVTVPEDLGDLATPVGRVKLGRHLEKTKRVYHADMVRLAYRCSELDHTMRTAEAMGNAIGEVKDQIIMMALVRQFEEILKEKV